MVIITKQFGQLEITEEQILMFKQGIPGFGHCKRFVVIEVEETPFSYLQSIDEGELAFLLADPFLFYPDYEFDLSDNTAEELQVTSQEQLLVRCIVTVKDKLEQGTLNLVGPIVINTEQRLGKQMILSTAAYTTKHPLLSMKEAANSGKAASSISRSSEGTG